MKEGLVSIVIPGRNEKYFQQTIDSCLENAGGDIEIIAVVDGYEPDPPLKEHPKVKILKIKESIGQRAGYNYGVSNSEGEYIMKLDAHAMPCPNYDLILKKDCPDQTTIIPRMRRLNVRTWKPKRGKGTDFMYFGTNMYCGYWKDYKGRAEAQGDIVEVMTGQGSCWFMKREWHDYIEGLDEKAGSWGKVGIELSCKTWLYGGRQVVNKNVWQAHWFRVGDGGFPYPMDGRQIAKAKNYVLDMWFRSNGEFKKHKQIRSIEWLIHKFSPVPSWEWFLQNHTKNKVVNDFHEMFYWHFKSNDYCRWMGYKTDKFPTDLMAFQELLHKRDSLNEPIDVIVEVGTGKGGSALFFAHTFDLIGNGKVISVDKKNKKRMHELPEHKRIEYIGATPTRESTVELVRKKIEGKRCMVVLGSEKIRANVKRQMKKYGKMVSGGCYLVVENTNLNGHPVCPDNGPGPWEAIDWYMRHWDDFERIPLGVRHIITGEKYLLTRSPGGWLRKK